MDRGPAAPAGAAGEKELSRNSTFGICFASVEIAKAVKSTRLKDTPGFRTVLKYCRDINEEPLRGSGEKFVYWQNSKVVQILDHDLDHDPPYFVMK